MAAILRTLLVVALLTAAGGALADDLSTPRPLISSFSLSTGWHYLDNDPYKDTFGLERLPTWTLRYDHRAFRFLQLGLGVSASGKSSLYGTVWAGEDHEVYPVHYKTTSFQYQWEAGLRLQGPWIGPVASSASFSWLMSRVRVETTGYASGYDALWESYLPAEKIERNASGTRISLALAWRYWANVSLMLESSLVTLDDYDSVDGALPDVGTWNHSGWRTELGLLQQF